MTTPIPSHPNADPAPAPIAIFRPGTFVSAEGREVSFSRDDLAAIAAGYDAASDPAPLVVGHPRMDDPAFGWVDRLSVDDDGRLLAHPAQVEPAFAEAVRAGRYRKISAQFYAPDSAANPRPGGYSLKHVGFLGAMAPAVKGLGTVSLSEDADNLVTIDLVAPAAPPATPLHQENTVTASPDQLASFAERETALAEREAALTAREEAAAKAAREARHADNLSFAEGLIAQARLAPADKVAVVGVLDALGDLPSGSWVSFGEGQADQAPAAALRQLLSRAAPVVDTAELAAPLRNQPMTASFAAPTGYDVSPERAALYARARAAQAENPALSLVEAASLVQRQAA